MFPGVMHATTARHASAAATADRADTAQAGDPARILRITTFEMAWRLIRDTHFDPEYNGVDWDALHEELMPKVEVAGSNEEVRAIINEMVGRLGQSHFGIIEQSAAEMIDADSVRAEGKDRAPAEDEPEISEGPGEVGLDVRVLEDRVIVTRVLEDSPAAEAGIGPGWQITEINGRELRKQVEHLKEHLDERTRDLYLWQSVAMRLNVDAGRSVRLTVVDGEDQTHEIRLRSTAARGEETQFGNLPPMLAHLETDEIIVPGEGADSSERRIGVIRFNVWMISINEPFAEAIDRFRQHDGIIIDLRGNIGGVAGMVMGIGGHFVDTSTSLGTMVTRESQLQFRLNPRRINREGDLVEPFDGPLAILIDGQSASTSEVFAGGMQAIGRARLFGTTTAGAALPAFLSELPSGDRLMHAVADYLDPNGQSLEGRGAVPDEEVLHEPAALLRGRDEPQEAAKRWILSQFGRE